jgi:hypothetical protein
MAEERVEVAREFEGISLGMISGGPSEAAESWVRAWQIATRTIEAARGDIVSPLALNVVFHVPGQFLTPEFTGLRTGRFSKKDLTLMVQVAMPDVPAPPNAVPLLYDLVADAIDLAEEFALRRKAISTPLNELREILATARTLIGSAQSDS